VVEDQVPSADAATLAALTDKQREVLDLLIEHKTSKEISRLIGISPHTVDQRLAQARAKLGGGNRGEVANEYRRLKSLWEGAVYQFSYIDKTAYLADSLHGTDHDEPETAHLPEAGLATSQTADFRVGSELFEGQWGTLARLVAILAIALFLVLLVLGGVSMFVSLSNLSGR